ncbi:hypothetical protein PSTG_15376 [Puccinia striiformis f. sp. tritici PST-78]|uniref:BED-type domain-containing protein n=1 Tax=Puccinia striiformis f. sp. tritici PST-78 TaxID=1165861 RepID=A0A0L0UVY8_9BASI|nr:hypothetical protein PSTG_15376 [Puccinia striiformis f. sp. tritici PST-78]
MASDCERPPHQSSCASSALGNQTDDDEPEPNTKADPSTPNSTQPSGATQALTDHEELLKTQKTAHNAVSTCYLAYKEPQLSNQKDKHGRRMIGYPCKMCGTLINRPMSNTSCGNLNKHIATCTRKNKASKPKQSLAAFGVTGTGDINPKEVPQLCAVWCAEAAILRPFGSQRKRTTTNMRSAEPNGSDSDESAAEYENAEDQIRVLSLGETAVDSEEEDQSNDEALAPAE